jgi:uncharacterized protein (TIGR01777 family)
MRVTVTGGTGRIGSGVVEALVRRGDEVTVLTRDPRRAAARLPEGVIPVTWEPMVGPAPAEALSGRAGVVHLAGEDVAQRWTSSAKQRIRASREVGTRNLVAGIANADPRPAALVSGSAAGYYGPRGDEPVDESTPPGNDFLAGVCVAWEREARRAEELVVRVAIVRNGIVLDAHGGALAKMLPFFRLGIGGPVAGGRQYMPWIHRDDEIGLLLQAIDSPGFSGPVNAAAPAAVTNAEFSKALGRALRRPAIMPVPALAIRALYGEMSSIVVTGVRMLPGRVGELGYEFRHTELEEALRGALARP